METPDTLMLPLYFKCWKQNLAVQLQPKWKMCSWSESRTLISHIWPKPVSHTLFPCIFVIWSVLQQRYAGSIVMQRTRLVLLIKLLFWISRPDYSRKTFNWSNYYYNMVLPWLLSALTVWEIISVFLARYKKTFDFFFFKEVFCLDEGQWLVRLYDWKWQIVGVRKA